MDNIKDHRAAGETVVRISAGTYRGLARLSNTPPRHACVEARRQAMTDAGQVKPGESMKPGESIMSKYALYVPLEAKPGKEKEVADFLRSAVPLVNAEAGTISWFAIQEGPSRFAIFDTFDDDAGRNAHLNGKVAAALMEKAKTGDLFAKTPEIHRIDVLADKLPH
jgi:quinol monooxygenase YgiN